MFFKASDKGSSYQLVFEIPKKKLGQRYASVKEVVGLFDYFRLRMLDYGLTERLDHLVAANEEEILKLSKCILAMALIREQHSCFIKTKTRKAIERQKEIIKNKELSKQKSSISSGPILKSNTLNMAIKQQFETRSNSIELEKVEKVVKQLAQTKTCSKIKSNEDINREVEQEFKLMASMADWMRPGPDLNELLDWLEVQIDVFDQALSEASFTDIDDFNCAVYSAVKGKELINYITIESKSGFQILPKNLQKAGYKFGEKK